MVFYQYSRSLGESHDKVNQLVLKNMIVRNLKRELGESLPQAPRVDDGRRDKGVWVSQVSVGREHSIQSFGRHFRGNDVGHEIHRYLFSNDGDKGLVLAAVEFEANWLVSFAIATVAEEKHEEHVEQEGNNPDIAGRDADDDRQGKILNDSNECSHEKVGYEPL